MVRGGVDAVGGTGHHGPALAAEAGGDLAGDVQPRRRWRRGCPRSTPRAGSRTADRRCPRPTAHTAGPHPGRPAARASPRHPGRSGGYPAAGSWPGRRPRGTRCSWLRQRARAGLAAGRPPGMPARAGREGAGPDAGEQLRRAEHLQQPADDGVGGFGQVGERGAGDPLLISGSDGGHRAAPVQKASAWAHSAALGRGRPARSASVQVCEQACRFRASRSMLACGCGWPVSGWLAWGWGCAGSAGGGPGRGRPGRGLWSPEGGLPEEVSRAPLAWPLDADALEDLRWYLEDYLLAPFGVWEDRGPAVAEKLAGWGEQVFGSVFGRRPGAGCLPAGAGPGAGGGVPVR